jgi:hypothetical protein
MTTQNSAKCWSAYAAAFHMLSRFFVVNLRTRNGQSSTPPRGQPDPRSRSWSCTRNEGL